MHSLTAFRHDGDHLPALEVLLAGAALEVFVAGAEAGCTADVGDDVVVAAAAVYDVPTHVDKNLMALRYSP